MADQITNFGVTTIATPPSPATTGTSFVVASGTGALFPAANVNDWNTYYNLTVWPAGVNPTLANAEIVRVTSRSGDTFTFTRVAENSTPAITMAAGMQVAQNFTKKQYDDLFSEGVAVELGRNRIGLWQPPGNTSTNPGILGIGSLTQLGTPTQRNIATTNPYTRRRKQGYITSTTAGTFAGNYLPAAQVTIGNGSIGGFRIIFRFGCSDAATVAGARQFVGVSSATGAPTNVEPNTLTNSIGIGNGASDTNLMIYYGGSTAQTPINLGSNFPANTLSVDAYEFELIAPLDGSAIRYQVRRLDTAFAVNGTLGPGTAGTTLPAAATLLAPLRAWRTNNATALAAGIDILSYYTEVDW